MRSHPSEYELVAPGKLTAVLELLAREPGVWLPIAGGTEVMVQYGAGKLAARKLVSLWGLPELRRIERTAQQLLIGAGCTYSDLRNHPQVAQEFPLLARAASWTGSLANQNRGTLGGNIVNASPAADSLPALLVYEAELLLVSVRGERRIPYLEFHTGYKRTMLARDEIIAAVALQPRFQNYHSYSRKVGARNAQAIAKLCLAGLGKVSANTIEDLRLAIGSMAVTPVRLRRTEESLIGRAYSPALLRDARAALEAEVAPIDDIRSSADYRLHVAGNLLQEFVESLLAREQIPTGGALHPVLARWHALPAGEAAAEILSCCGSRTWAAQMAAKRPYADEQSIFAAADSCWQNLAEADWIEAFRSHPRIGEKHAQDKTTAASAAWSRSEQSQMKEANAAILLRMQEGHRRYEERFGRIFIVCASQKQPAELLCILESRLTNGPEEELKESALQQQQIMQLRLRKWLAAAEVA